MRTPCRERPRTAGRGGPWQPFGRGVSASRHLKLGTWPWLGCIRGSKGRPRRCCVWSARPSRPSGAAPVPFRRSISDFWLENDFLFLAVLTRLTPAGPALGPDRNSCNHSRNSKARSAAAAEEGNRNLRLQLDTKGRSRQLFTQQISSRRRVLRIRL